MDMLQKVTLAIDNDPNMTWEVDKSINGFKGKMVDHRTDAKLATEAAAEFEDDWVEYESERKEKQKEGIAQLEKQLRNARDWN